MAMSAMGDVTSFAVVILVLLVSPDVYPVSCSSRAYKNGQYRE